MHYLLVKMNTGKLLRGYVSLFNTAREIAKYKFTSMGFTICTTDINIYIGLHLMIVFMINQIAAIVL